MRRHRENPTKVVTYALVGVGVVAVGVGAFFVLRKHEVAVQSATNTGALGGASPGVLATVVTHDAPPSGDLVIRSSPSDDAAIVGAAEKDGQVTIIDGNASATYAQIEWDGGSRRPAASGFAHKAFLSLV